MQFQHQGFMNAGEFWRGQHRGGGKVVNAVERDRVRALQLMNQALPLAVKDENHAEVGDFLLDTQDRANQKPTSGSWPASSVTPAAPFAGTTRHGRS